MAVLRDLLTQSFERTHFAAPAPLAGALEAYRAAVLAGPRDEEDERFRKFIDLADKHLEGTLRKWKAEELAEAERLQRLEERLIQGEQELSELENALEESEARVGAELLSSMLAAGDTGSSCEESDGSSDGPRCVMELPGVEEVEWRRNQMPKPLGMVLLDERPAVKSVAQLTPGASEMMAPCQALPREVELQGGLWKNWDRVARDHSNLQKARRERT